MKTSSKIEYGGIGYFYYFLLSNRYNLKYNYSRKLYELDSLDMAN